MLSSAVAQESLDVDPVRGDAPGYTNRSPSTAPETEFERAKEILAELTSYFSHDDLASAEPRFPLINGALHRLTSFEWNLLASFPLDHEEFLEHLSRFPSLATCNPVLVENYLVAVARDHKLPAAARLIGSVFVTNLQLGSPCPYYLRQLLAALGESGSTAACDTISFVLAGAVSQARLMDLVPDAVAAYLQLGANGWPIAPVLQALSQSKTPLGAHLSTILRTGTQPNYQEPDTRAILAKAAEAPASQRPFIKSVLADRYDDSDVRPVAAAALRQELLAETAPEIVDEVRARANLARLRALGEHEWAGLSRLMSNGTRISFSDPHSVSVTFSSASDVLTDLRLLGRADLLVDSVTFGPESIPFYAGLRFTDALACRLGDLQGLSALRMRTPISAKAARRLAHSLLSSPIEDLDVADSRMSNASINRLLAIGGNGQLKRLDLSGCDLGPTLNNRPSPDSPLYTLAALSGALAGSLETLVARDSGVQYLTSRLFASTYKSMRNLAHVDIAGATYTLYGSGIDNLCNAFSAHSPHSLGLSGTQLHLSGDGLARVVRTSPELKHLNLDYIWLNAQVIGTLSMVDPAIGLGISARGLKHAGSSMDVDYKALGVPAERLFEMPLFSRAPCIDLSENRLMGASQLRALLGQARQAEMTELYLGDVDVRRRSAAKIVSQSACIETLVRLDLTGSLIDKLSAELMARKALHLRHLWCAGCNLGDREMSILSSRLAAQLVTLDIGYNSISDSFLTEMALQEWPLLSTLCLDHCSDITPYGVAELVRSPFLPHLLTIHYNDTLIDVQRERVRVGMRVPA